jgi:hypothetical protein
MDAISKAYMERQSLRATGRIFNVSHFFVQQALKQKPKFRPFQGNH